MNVFIKQIPYIIDPFHGMFFNNISLFLNKLFYFQPGILKAWVSHRKISICLDDLLNKGTIAAMLKRFFDLVSEN